MDINEALQKLAGAQLPSETISIRQALAAYLNELLLHDFPALIQILYRADVSEQKLKTTLQANKEVDAGELIADLLLQRHKEKAAIKTAFPNTHKPAADEAW